MSCRVAVQLQWCGPAKQFSEFAPCVKVRSMSFSAPGRLKELGCVDPFWATALSATTGMRFNATGTGL